MRGFYIFLFIVAVQIIAGIAQKRKKDAERRAREEAMSRQLQNQPNSAEASAGSTAATANNPDLEARRKAQLEQLRQRREGRKIGNITNAPPLPPPRAGMAIKTQLATRPTASIAPTIGTSDNARSKAQIAERVAKDAERQRREQQGRLAAAQQDLEDAAAHKSYESGFHSVADERNELHATPASRGGAAQTLSTKATKATKATSVTASTARLRPGGDLLQGLRDPRSLRDAMILRELLDRPLSLRHGQV